MQHPTNKTITTNLPDHRPQGIHNFFLPDQLRFIHDPSRERIVRKSRQIGVSHNAAYDLVDEASRAANPSAARVSSREGSYSPVASDLSPITSSSAAPPHPLSFRVLCVPLWLRSSPPICVNPRNLWMNFLEVGPVPAPPALGPNHWIGV
jgi:hypothetical protein